MKNPLKSYSFWIKILASALLITLGIWLIIDVSTQERFSIFIVLMFTGLAASIFSIIRLIPLMKTLKTAKGRMVSITEIAIHIALSIAMIFAAIVKLTDENSDFADFVYQYYRYFIAFYFYSCVVSYFICIVLCGEETDKIKFWTHIGLMTISCILCAIPFKGKTIAWIISFLALACSIALIVEGGMGYSRYRKAIARDQQIRKEEEQDEKDALKMPAEDPIVIPMIEDETNESVHIN